jgi:hypothetical protein
VCDRNVGGIVLQVSSQVEPREADLFIASLSGAFSIAEAA